MLITLVALVVLLVGLYLWASGGDAYTDGPGPGELVSLPATAPPPVGDTLTVMSFNIGYGRGPAGDEAGPWTREHITSHLDAIAAQIAESGADLAALQEVDLAAERSHDIDEARYLLERLGWGHASCVVTWEKNHVPFPYWPPSKHYGRMRSGSCLLSRYPIKASTRHPLPQPDQPFFRNAFYFQRALDEARVELRGEEWVVFNVHLEAFDLDNRHAQAKILRDAIAAVSHDRVLVIGDFNAIPPGASPREGYADEPEMDFSGDETLARSFSGLAFQDAGGLDTALFTFPALAPTRRLDYIFHTPALEALDARALAAPPGPHSDHLPVVARFRFASRR
jgi:endonuclease/exonuclease/phosphatase family metal-dependent hydrolase